MAKEKITKPEEETMRVAMSKTESFLEQHAKSVTYVLIGLIVLAGCIFGYKKLVVEPRMEKASVMMLEAENRLGAENPDFQLALEGDEDGAGFLDVIEQYGSTPSGNIAYHCAGICYLRLGDLENAAKYLAKYNAVKGLPGSIINAQNLGLRGDVAFEQGDYAAASNLYLKAVKAAENDYTTPLYLRKAGLSEAVQGNNAKAQEYYQQILSNYPRSAEARTAEKLMGSVNE